MVEDFLKGIKASNIRPERVATASGSGVDPVQHARNRLIESINQHKMLVQADIDGRELKLTITKRKDGQEVTVPKRILRWYFQAGGNWHTVIRYGTSALQFEGGDALQAGPNLGDVIKIYDRIAKAVGEGKVDKHIEIAKQRAPRGSKGAAASPENPQEEEEFEPPPPAADTRQVRPNFRKQARA